MKGQRIRGIEIVPFTIIICQSKFKKNSSSKIEKLSLESKLDYDNFNRKYGNVDLTMINSTLPMLGMGNKTTCTFE